MNNKRIILGTLVILFGISLLLNINILRFFIPLLLIFFGLKIMTGKDGIGIQERSQSQEEKVERVLIFSGMSDKNLSENYQGGSIVAIFGGGELDLTKAKTKQEEIKLELVAIFGGIKVKVPSNWQVNSEGMGILGGFNNKTVGDKKTVTKLKIEGVGIFGGVEVVN